MEIENIFRVSVELLKHDGKFAINEKLRGNRSTKCESNFRSCFYNYTETPKMFFIS